MEVISKCVEINVAFILLPPNSTHLTKPLDVAFFRPMKGHWRKILGEWKATAEGRRESSIPKSTFPKLLKKLADAIQTNQNENLKSGFKKCGVAPYNPNAVLQRLPKQPDETENQDEQNTSDIVDSSFTSFLKEMCGLDAPATRKRSKRLKVPPGRSVSHHSEEAQQKESNNEDGIEATDQNDNQTPGVNHHSIEAQCGESIQEGDGDDDEHNPIPGPSNASRPRRAPKRKRKAAIYESSSEESEVELILDDESDLDLDEMSSDEENDLFSVDEVCARFSWCKK